MTEVNNSHCNSVLKKDSFFSRTFFSVFVFGVCVKNIKEKKNEIVPSASMNLTKKVNDWLPVFSVV
jgi:membrane-anchored glycerophosphoryl diester phosphodiesterase (GDPDase)